MSDTSFGFPHDHGTIAWEHWLAQHAGKLYTYAFVTAHYPPLNTVDKAQNDLYTLRWLETSFGLQLDGVGSIVGQSRVLPESAFLPFFGFVSQPAGRAFGVARMRHEWEGFETSTVLGDVEFRQYILAKIGINNGHGTVEDIIAYAKGLFPQWTDVQLTEIGNASFNLTITATDIAPFDYREAIFKARVPRAAGVLMNLTLVGA